MQSKISAIRALLDSETDHTPYLAELVATWNEIIPTIAPHDLVLIRDLADQYAMTFHPDCTILDRDYLKLKKAINALPANERLIYEIYSSVNCAYEEAKGVCFCTMLDTAIAQSVGAQQP